MSIHKISFRPIAIDPPSQLEMTPLVKVKAVAVDAPDLPSSPLSAKSLSVLSLSGSDSPLPVTSPTAKEEQEEELLQLPSLPSGKFLPSRSPSPAVEPSPLSVSNVALPVLKTPGPRMNTRPRPPTIAIPPRPLKPAIIPGSGDFALYSVPAPIATLLDVTWEKTGVYEKNLTILLIKLNLR